MNRTTVLVVDNYRSLVRMHVGNLQGYGLTIVTAHSLPELDAKYAEYCEDLAAIILDGCVPGLEVNTYGFISKVKADKEAGRFTGVLMAAAGSSDNRRLMMEAGCTHGSPKTTAARRVLELLTAPKGT